MKRGILILIISVVVLAVIVSAIIIFSTPTTLTCSGATPNECNEQCWENCTVHHIFQCATSGGMCAADPNDCPTETPHSCNGSCWACNANETFACNSSIGGTCQRE
jgi:hypothetical protein